MPRGNGVYVDDDDHEDTVAQRADDADPTPDVPDPEQGEEPPD